MSTEKEQQYLQALEKALATGEAILNGGTALEAVEATIKTMEDNPLLMLEKEPFLPMQVKMNWMLQLWMAKL
jgi:hypothetical protein